MSAVNKLSASGYNARFGRFVPRYALFSAPFCLLLDCLIYFLAKIIQSFTELPYHSLVLPPDALPFVPAFMWVYVGCFLFWILMFPAVSQRGKAEWYRFFTANTIGLLVCGVFFVLLPTKINRPEVTGTGLTAWLCRFIYAADTPAVDLFPSIHCFGAWMCHIGVRGQKRYPLWLRVFTPLFAIFVCFSTMFVKQHFFIDTIAGIVLAELCVLFVKFFPKTALPLERAFDALDSAVFKK